MNSSSLRCSMCDQLSTAKSIGTSQQLQLFSCRDDLKTHIAAVHIQCYNYFCQICVDYPRFATASALNKHYDGMHATDEYTMNQFVSKKTREQKAQLKQLLSESMHLSSLDDCNNINDATSYISSVEQTSQLAIETITDDDTNENDESNSVASATANSIILDQLFANKTTKDANISIGQNGIMVKMDNIDGSNKKTSKRSIKRLSHVLPRLQQSTAGDGQQSAVMCKLCVHEINSSKNIRRSVYNHIVQVHLHEAMYRCRICPKQWSRLDRRSQRRHANTVHSSTVEETIDDRHDIFADQIAELMRQCFDREYKERKKQQSSLSSTVVSDQTTAEADEGGKVAKEDMPTACDDDNNNLMIDC